MDTYVGRIRPGQADVKSDEAKRRLILIEFDHQRGIALDNDEPSSRNHIRTVVRTQNGNDYGKDLLRRHHEQFDHSRPGHRH